MEEYELEEYLNQIEPDVLDTEDQEDYEDYVDE